jgi:hypothetical protein
VLPPSPDEGDKRSAAYSPPQFPQIQVVLDREHEIARQQLAAGHKDRALVALRKRKYQEGLLVKTDSQLENLEQLVRTPAIDLQIPLFRVRVPSLLPCGCVGLDNRVLCCPGLRVTWPQTG